MTTGQKMNRHIESLKCGEARFYIKTSKYHGLSTQSRERYCYITQKEANLLFGPLVIYFYRAYVENGSIIRSIRFEKFLKNNDDSLDIKKFYDDNINDNSSLLFRDKNLNLHFTIEIAEKQTCRYPLNIVCELGDMHINILKILETSEQQKCQKDTV